MERKREKRKKEREGNRYRAINRRETCFECQRRDTMRSSVLVICRSEGRGMISRPDTGERKGESREQ